MHFILNFIVTFLIKFFTRLDPGATRAKRIPIWKLKVEDENEIPAKPDVIFDKPNDKQYEKKINEIKEKIEYHKTSLKDLKVQIDKERSGNNPEMDKFKAQKEELAQKLEPIQKELVAAREFCKGSEEIKSLKIERSALTYELEITDLNDFNEEIKRIQKKLGFGNLNAGEEKKLIDKKNKLETQRPKIQKLNDMKTKLTDLVKQYGPSLKKIGELSEKTRDLIEKKRQVGDKLKSVYDERKANDPAIKNLQLQRDSIKAEIDKLKAEIVVIENVWNDKWYHFEAQQKVLDYIKEATSKINLLKKKAERDQKRREKSEKKGKDEVADEETPDDSPSKPKIYYGYEIATCEWLIKYFKNLIGEGKSEQDEKAKEVLTSQSKIADDLKSGSLKVLNRDDKFPTIDNSSRFNNKKKMKKENINKKAGDNFLVLDISLISKVKELGLIPPVFADAVKPFIPEVEAKLIHYQEEAKKKMEETSETAQEAV